MPFTAETARLAREKRDENARLRAAGLLPPLPPKPPKAAPPLTKLVKVKPSYAQPDPPGRISLREHDVHGVSDVVESRSIDVYVPEFDFQTAPLSECEAEVTRLREVIDIGSRTIEARRSLQPRTMWHCAVCRTPIPDGKWKFKDDSRRDPQTGLISPAVVCSSTCYSRYWAERPRLGPRR